MSCVLREIAVDESHPHIVARHRQTVTILNLHPATEGHLMVLPRRHVADAWSCPVELYRSVYGSVHAAATLLRERLGVDGVTIVEAVRAAGWQSVAHLHTHVLPRRIADDMQPIWTAPARADEAQLADLRRRLTGEA